MKLKTYATVIDVDCPFVTYFAGIVAFDEQPTHKQAQELEEQWGQENVDFRVVDTKLGRRLLVRPRNTQVAQSHGMTTQLTLEVVKWMQS